MLTQSFFYPYDGMQDRFIQTVKTYDFAGNGQPKKTVRRTIVSNVMAWQKMTSKELPE